MFRIGEDASIDEAIARCASRFTSMKHLQSKYKPHDGIRAYCLNDSTSGYLADFHIDTRKSHETIEYMFRCVPLPLYNTMYC